jgi:hypothetical protein
MLSAEAEQRQCSVERTLLSIAVDLAFAVDSEVAVAVVVAVDPNPCTQPLTG